MRNKFQGDFQSGTKINISLNYVAFWYGPTCHITFIFLLCKDWCVVPNTCKQVDFGFVVFESISCF